MEVIPLSSDFYIDSHKGSYAVKFSPFNSLKEYPLNSSSDLIVIDRNLLKLYPDRFSEIEDFRYLPIDASEKNKSLDKFPRYIQKLVDLNFKKSKAYSFWWRYNSRYNMFYCFNHNERGRLGISSNNITSSSRLMYRF